MIIGTIGVGFGRPSASSTEEAPDLTDRGSGRLDPADLHPLAAVPR